MSKLVMQNKVKALLFQPIILLFTFPQYFIGLWLVINYWTQTIDSTPVGVQADQLLVTLAILVVDHLCVE